jgi:hypothetical protein
MLLSSIIPGNPVQVACDLSAAQIAACGHALRTVREWRFRTSELSIDDTLALRELTTVIDRFEQLEGHGAHDTVQVSAARLVLISDAVRDFVVATAESDAVTEASRTHFAVAAALVDPLGDLAQQALQVALADLPQAELSDADFDALLGD